MFMHTHSKSAFTIELVSNKQTNDLLVARSSLDSIREVVEMFRSKKNETIDLTLLTTAIKVLSKLLCFVHNEEYDPEEDYAENPFSSDPIKERQAIMRDMGVIDLLMDLVHFPFSNGYYFLDEVEKPLYISKVVSLGYILIKSIIRELRQNELHASQWLDMFAEYALKDIKNSLNIKDTLTELIDNNEKILDVQITEDLVNHILTYFLNSTPDKRIISIIRAMCICNGKPVLKNQELISGVLLADKVTLSKVLSGMKRNEQGDIVIHNPWDNSNTTVINLKELLSKSNKMDEGNYFEYYINFLALLAELGLGRNYKAINILKSYFPEDILADIFRDNEFNPQLRTASIKLAEVLYIDVFPFQPLSIPHQIRDMSLSMTDNYSLEVSSQSKQTIGESQKRLLADMLKMIRVPPNINEISDYSDLYIQVIGLCQKMIRLGYISSFSEIKQVYDGVINLTAFNWQEEQSDSKSRAKLNENSVRIVSISLKSRSDQLVELQDKVDKVKMCLCSMLVELLDVEIDFQISRTIVLYKNFLDGNTANSLNKPTLENQSLVIPEEEHQEKEIEIVNKKPLFDMIDKLVLRSDNLIEKESNLRNFLIDNTLSENKELKDFSFQLLKQMYSGGQRLITILEKLIVVDNEQGRHLFKRSSDIQVHLFKLIEKFPSWINKDYSLKNEYSQLLDLLGKLDEDFKEAGRLNVSQLGSDLNQMSNQLYELSREHLFIKIHLQKLLDFLSHFYQCILEKTGTLDCLIRLVNLLVNSLFNPETKISEHVMEANKVLLDSLILLICKSVHGNEENKPKLLPSLLNWLKVLPKLNHKGRRIFTQNSKSIFSAKNIIGSETSNKLLEGSTNLKKNKQFILTEYSTEAEVPIFGNLIQLVIHTLRNSREQLKDLTIVSNIAKGLIEILTQTNPQGANSYLMAQCFFALEELMFDNQTPIPENQSLIIKLIAENGKLGVLQRFQNSSILTVLTRDLNLQELDERIESTSVLVIPSKLSLDLAFISLIALCTFGKNEYTERLAQSILSPK